MLHLSDAWARRHHGNIVLVHFDDLVSDLDRAMRNLAEVLGVAVDEGRWPALVHAATFGAMRESGAASAPEGLGVLKDPAAFFRRGVSGDGPALFAPTSWPTSTTASGHGTGGDARLAAPD